MLNQVACPTVQSPRSVRGATQGERVPVYRPTARWHIHAARPLGRPEGPDLTLAAVAAALHAIAPGLAAYSIAIVFIGYVVLGVSGFGSALTIVPLLALKWPLVTVVPVVLLTDLPSTLLLARLNVRGVRWSELGVLVPGIIAGASLGAWVARWTAQPWALALLAAYVIAVAVRRTGAVAPGHGAGRPWAGVAGVLAGVIESMYGTAGPVLVAWLSRRLHDPSALRATVLPALVAVTGCALTGMAVSGQLSQALVWAAFPFVFCTGLLGTTVGHHIARRLPAAVARRAILGLLFFAGTAMALHAWQMAWPG